MESPFFAKHEPCAECGHSTLKVTIFQKMEDGSDRKIGEYDRNYHSFFNTFVPFKKGDKWYALYSRSYLETRVMSLPDCEDIANNDDSQFCPVAFYVPSLEDLKEVDYSEEESRSESLEGTFAFIAGCHWGDDSSWKIGVIDLRNLDNGSIKVEPYRLGYLELSESIKLKDAIRVSHIGKNGVIDVGISQENSYSLWKEYYQPAPWSVSKEVYQWLAVDGAAPLGLFRDRSDAEESQAEYIYGFDHTGQIILSLKKGDDGKYKKV